jgi:hypothetical protein
MNIQPNSKVEATLAKKGNAMPAAGCAYAMMPNTIMRIAIAVVHLELTTCSSISDSITLMFISF